MKSKLDHLGEFKLEVDEFDAISFTKDKEGNYSFIIMKLNDTPEDYEISDLGHKFIHLFFTNNNMDYEIYDAILGDPAHNLRNYIASNSQGIIIKKCSVGAGIIRDMVESLELQKAANVLNELIQKNKAKVV